MDEGLLSKLVSTPGVSGREERIRDLVAKEIGDLVDDVKIDRLGNVLGTRKGTGPRVMLCAHMDSIGFLVSHIDDKGYVRISPVGGFDPRTLVAQRVLVLGRNDYVGLLGGRPSRFTYSPRTNVIGCPSSRSSSWISCFPPRR